MSYKYPLVNWLDFSINLLKKFDLDPIYVILTNTTIPENVLKRWLLAYWCYYSAGTASHIAEQPDFYAAMRQKFSGEGQYPRGHERRHFRGNDGWKAIEYLEQFGAPEKVVDHIYTGAMDYQSVAGRAMQFKLFGPWIAWKICDMGERVMCLDVDFSNTNLYMYKDPVQGAALYMYEDWQHPISKEEVGWVVEDILEVLGDMRVARQSFLAPPHLDRPLNIQEVETLLCKYKAHVKGHYPINFDLTEIRHGLVGWGDLAQQLLGVLPDGETDYQ